jgi:hypothetical protein
LNAEQKPSRTHRIFCFVILPVFVFMCAHKPESAAAQPPAGVHVQHQTDAEASLIEDAGSKSSGGPLRILGFIARAAKSSRRKEESAHSPMAVPSPQMVHIAFARA